MSSICEGIVYDVHPSNTLCVQGVAAEFLTADVQSLGTLVVSSNKRPERPPVEKGAASFWFRTCFDFRAAWPWNARPLLKRWSSLVPSPGGGVNSDCRRTEPTAFAAGEGDPKTKGSCVCRFDLPHGEIKRSRTSSTRPRHHRESYSLDASNVRR